MTTLQGADSAAVQPAPLGPEATVELLALAKQGNAAALNRLLERCIPALRRWARGRLPHDARGMLDTADIVQDSVVAAMRQLGGFESRHQGALMAYLRMAVLNRIKDMMRQHRRRPHQTDLPEQLLDQCTSPLDRAIGAQQLDRYEAALARLRAGDREAIVGRVELEYTFAELAVALGKPSADAARVAVTRALQRLAEEMTRGI